MNHLEFKPLIEQLQLRATRSVVSQYAFKNKALIKHLRSIYSAIPGEEGALLADPVFEAMFPWQQAETPLEELRNTLLSSHMMKMLASFKYPFKHQLTAWQQILDEKKSVLVSSGTGSGKTECFLVPILEDLVRQQKAQRSALVGTQAIFLYPLNALINSQQERLSKWTKDLKGNIRFALYNGETEHFASDVADEQSKAPEQVMSRELLWQAPPSILVTNATMLEYMLVRKEDQPILEQSRSMLKYIVLDEAHTYIGSHAAELALLLRRVMTAFDVGPGTEHRVQIIATSATIGEDTEKGNRQLAKYLADLAGVSEHELQQKVQVVRGYRDIVQLDDALQPVNAFNLEHAKKIRQESAAALFDYLACHALPRKLRQLFEGNTALLAQHGLAGSLAFKLSILTKVAQTIEPEFTRTEVLDLLDLMSYAKRDDEAFVPLRLHLFQRTLAGLWGCVNNKCTHKASDLEHPSWLFGKVFVENRKHCDCGAPVMEMVSCNECGSNYLAAEEYLWQGKSYLRARYESIREDDFLLDQEIEVDENDEEQGASSGFERLIGEGGKKIRLSLSQESIGQIDPTTGEATEIGLIHPHITESTKRKGFKCPCCDAKEYLAGTQFRSARLGAPFFLGDIIPTMLELSPLPKDQTEWQNPSFGKRLLTFTDSRQGTARLSTRLQQDVDRNANRTAIYHELLNLEATKLPSATPEQIALVEELADQAKAYSFQALARALENLLAGQNLSEADQQQIVSFKLNLREKVDQLAALEAVANSVGANTQEVVLHSWESLASAIVGTSTSFDTRKNRLERTSNLKLMPNQYADFCLYAEFLFRPKKTWSLETLGLVSIVYPEIQALEAIHVPDVWKMLVLDEKRQLPEWKNLLKIVLDYFVRTNGAVYLENNEYKNWLGTRRPRRLLKSPEIKIIHDKYDLIWPHIHDRGFNRIIKLILAVFPQIIPSETFWQGIIDELMNSVWRALYPSMKSRDAGFQLDLKEKAKFVSPKTVWICPYTRKAIDVVLMGYSPYLTNAEKREKFVAEKAFMPSLPARHWMDADGEWPLDKRIKWLESNPVIAKAREQNIWPNRSDRLVVKEHWFSLEEHSAQQSPETNKANEAKFKVGQLNVLNCSTTMEMGVDIGDMSLVAMNNVPPAAANYMQRAGRAGRRGETAAAAVTLCKNTPHGMEVFANPLWPFTSHAQPPQVRLESESIVQRHVNAYALGSYLHEKTKNATTLNCKWFFEGDAPHAKRFIAWIKTHHKDESNKQWLQGLRSLVKGTKLGHLTPSLLLARVAIAMEVVISSWQQQLQVMLCNMDELEKSDKAWESSPAGKSVLFQLNDYRRAYLFNTLSSLAFLPINGFPIGVVTFNYKTATELEHSRITKEQATNTDNRPSRRKAYFERLPTRDLPTALREYAPGVDVVLNGKVYRSAGVQLGRVLSSGQEIKQESQHLPYYWHCHKCGAGATQHTFPKTCANCHEQLKASNRHQYLQPVGFATDIRYSPHNDVSETRQFPFTPPRATLPSSNWQSLPDPELGRYRFSSKGELYHYSVGEMHFGYSVCLSCGRSQSQYRPGQIPDGLRDPKLESSHYRLRGGKTGQGNQKADKICHGSIKSDLFLGYSAKTEIIELQLNDQYGNPLEDKTQAWSLAVALREALARMLGIESKELGFSVQQAKSINDQLMFSLFIFDQSSGGAGYSSQLAEHWGRVFSLAHQITQCHCDSVCHRCLLSYDTQFVSDNLDRISLQQWLTPDFYHRLELNDKLKVLGNDSQFESISLPERIKMELSQAKGSECIVRLASDNSDWDLTSWSIFEDLAMFSLQNKGLITLLMTQEHFQALTEQQKHQLATLLNVPGINISLHLESNLTHQLQSHVTFGIRTATYWRLWARTEQVQLGLTEVWSSGIKSVTICADVEDFAISGEAIQLPLQSVIKGSSDVRINFQHELNGSLDGFGQRFWQLVFENHSDMASALSKSEIKSVRYNDRFLKSPHMVRLFGEIITQLNQHSSLDRALITVRTNSLQSNNSPQRNSFHDWENDDIRADCIRDLLNEGYLGESINGEIAISEGDKTGFDVDHSRELAIELSNGQSFYIIFDYGLGYWRVDGYSSYAFNCDVRQQVEQISQFKYEIIGSQYIKTYLIVGSK